MTVKKRLQHRPPPSLRKLDVQRAREQIAVAKLSPSEAILAAIRQKLDRLWLTTSKRGSINFGADEYGPEQFAAEVRDLLERPR